MRRRSGDSCLQESHQRDSFDAWMQEVVMEMETGFGMHPADLPDCSYADWYRSGMEPEEAAQEAISLCMADD